MRITKSSQEKNEKKNYKKVLQRAKKQIQGITLIALVVTIVILLILAGVALSLTVGDNGLFRRAQNAADTWQMAEQNEQQEMDKAADFLERYKNGNKPLNSVTGEETTNSIVYDKYGNKVVVPAGFKIINPDDDVTKGIVIEDVSANGATEYTKGSQFVWIPVGNVKTDSNGTSIMIELGRYTFGSSGTEKLVQSADNWSDTSDSAGIDSNGAIYKELANSDWGNATAKNLQQFVEQVQISRGYYIGRYEAGDAYAIENKRTGTNNISDPNNPVVCKKGVYPYTYVDQPDASLISKNMYKSEYFESDLINSYSWDTALIFIQIFSGDSNYSLQKGENTENSLQKLGESILKNVDNNDDSQDMRCNIYDMAGNAYEWTTELHTLNNYPCFSRGDVFLLMQRRKLQHA